MLDVGHNKIEFFYLLKTKHNGLDINNKWQKLILQVLIVINFWKHLWHRSSPESFFRFNGTTPPPFDMTKAKAQIHNGYADYVCGRVIKADIYSENTVDLWEYDGG